MNRFTFYQLLGCALPFLLVSSQGQVVINEIQSTTSERVLRFDAAGKPFLGCDIPWYAWEYVKPAFWNSATGPFGFGGNFTTGKNLQANISGKAMSVYLRREFTLTAAQAASLDPLELAIDYNDGFVAYLNGVEISRKNLGPTGAFAYVDQQTYNNHPNGTVEVLPIATAANTVLRTGKNVLAFQVHNNALNEGGQDAPNYAPGGGSMLCSPTLRTAGTTPVTLVAPGDSFDYFVGVHEPSGGLLDPAFFLSSIPGPNWSQIDYPDAAWNSVLGAMGYEFDASGDYLDQMGTNAQAAFGGMRNIYTSCYGRCEFTLTAAEYFGISSISLQTDWDDGYGLFLNGLEVDRQNVGGSPGLRIAYNSSATSHGATRDGGGRAKPIVYRSIPVNKSQLRVGKNVLAAQVQNAGSTSSDLLLDVQFSYTGDGTPNRTLITRNTPWKYLIPTSEIGVIPPATAQPVPEFHDWLELRNTGNTAISLAGWKITDSRNLPAKWTFPPGSSIGPNGYLLLACSGQDIQAPAAGGYLHTNFTLDPSGEYLALRNAAGTLVHEVTAMPKQDFFHTWGQDPATGNYRFLDTATPGTVNQAATTAYKWASEVEFSHETGYYTTHPVLSLSTLTPGATIRYTTDGSEPSLTNGLVYTAPFNSAAATGSTQGPGTGFVLREQWAGTTWPISGLTSSPTSLQLLTRVDHPGGADSYTSRIRGFLHPATTGLYTFYVAADDPGEFYLGTSSAPASKIRRCWCDSWCAYHDFQAQKQSYGGAAGDTSPQHPNQASVAILLTAGQKYYFEANQAEYGGGDHLSVAWTGPGIPTISVIEGRYTSPPDNLPSTVSYPSGAVMVRARAFAPGSLPSETRTRNFAVGFGTAYQQIPTVFLTAKADRTFYKTNGIFSVNGGSTGDWVPIDLGQDYNFCMMHGEPYERPCAIEVIKPGIPEPVVRTNVGIRFAGSPWSRPKYRDTNLEQSNWGGGWNSHEKPQINLHFRGDLGIKKLKQEGFIPDSQVDAWDNLRLRAGKNDAYNPLILDEMARRSFRAMGKNPAPIGFFANLFINGSWKGLFNPTERPREGFFQEFFQTANPFDTIYIGSFEDGDAVAYNQMFSYFGGADFSIPANYETGKTYWNAPNVADYLALYAWFGTMDFPQNNYVFARERSPGALWNFSMWDAEASFNIWGQTQDYDAFAASFGLNDLSNASVAADGGQVRRVVRRFAQNADFRMLVADRIQKHFFNGGSMSPTALLNRYTWLRSQVEGVIAAGYSQAYNASFWNDWTLGGNGRTAAFLTQATTYGLWPSTKPPTFSKFGGTVAPGSPLSLGNPNSAGTIYFTTNGTDPRLDGGAVAATSQTFSTPISIARPQTIKARVLNAGVWSALTEAEFAPPPPAVVFSEIFYNPPGGNEAKEFLELLNISNQPADLSGAKFSEGIDFTFGNFTLAPRARVVLISGTPATTLPAFQAAYPGVPVFGHYVGELSNTGETITLVDNTQALICTVTYVDASNPSWPTAADGQGASLVLKRPEIQTSKNLSNPNFWRRSVRLGGLPGDIDSTSFSGPNLLGDTDSDGVSSLIEYGLGTNDSDANSTPEYTLEKSGDTLVITSVCDGRTDDITIQAEQSQNLQNWTPMTLIQEDWDNPPGKVTRSWETSLDNANIHRLLLRLHVVKP